MLTYIKPETINIVFPIRSTFIEMNYDLYLLSLFIYEMYVKFVNIK